MTTPSRESMTRRFKATNSILRERRLVFALLLMFAALALHSHQFKKARNLQRHYSKQRQQNDVYFEIVQKAYNNTFAHLQTCPDDENMDACIHNTLESIGNTDTAVPWWFHTMLRDAQGIVTKKHHYLETPTPNGVGLHFCTIGKIGTKHWRRFVCRLQHQPSNGGRLICTPKTRISESAPRAVFLRDPLERFLSAYMDKCDSWHREAERHCEPTQIFVDRENGVLEGLDKNKKLMFEAYVNTMPLKWNMHFFPQSLYCDGLFRRLDTFDFVGVMGQDFYRDLEDMGQQFGLTKHLQKVFEYNHSTITSVGVENSASLHVHDYYTPSTVRKVLEYFAMDYVMLNLTIPTWAKEMLDSEQGEATSLSSNAESTTQS